MFSVSTSICSSVKGNPSKDGTKLVVRATNGQGELVAFTCDISAQRKYPDIKLTKFIRPQRILYNLAVRPLP